MMMNEEIKNNWETDITGYAQEIESLRGSGFPAWTVKFVDSYGVAIPYDGIDINEKFSNAKIYSSEVAFSGETIIRALVLATDSNTIGEPFSTLCAEFVAPGIEGIQRRRLIETPVSWWKKWKELLGNRTIDERIYDVLGELCVLGKLVSDGLDAAWNGPNSASYDIETENAFVEVKSTLNRSKREVTISSQFQLNPPGKPLLLVLCVFEKTINTGTSINDEVKSLATKGYNKQLINEKLDRLGFEEGMSSRNSKFMLHEMLKYKVDSNFPRITPESFIGGVLPSGITKITYSVDLSGLLPESMSQGEIMNDIQND